MLPRARRPCARETLRELCDSSSRISLCTTQIASSTAVVDFIAEKMQDLRELGAWLEQRDTGHEVLTPATLPDPCFTYAGREYVSFSTNNYLALATDPRMK